MRHEYVRAPHLSRLRADSDDGPVKEAEVVAAFAAYLRERGWDVTTTNADYSDVIAKRGAERLIAEVKGHTGSPGLDVDTMYGQILRRMTTANQDSTYAVVVPETLAKAVLRVSDEVRGRLRIEVFLVDDLGAVRRYDVRD